MLSLEGLDQPQHSLNHHRLENHQQLVQAIWLHLWLHLWVHHHRFLPNRHQNQAELEGGWEAS